MILIDADACPVKAEIVEVALRRGMKAIFVAGTYLRLAEHRLVSFFVAGDAFDAADDAIAAVAGPGTVTITADILLAERVLGEGRRGARPARAGIHRGRHRRDGGDAAT